MCRDSIRANPGFLRHLARDLGKQDDGNFLFGRASEYRSSFDPETGFFTPRDENGEWGNPDRDSGYCEGNKWIYLWFVPHDVQGLVDLMGGSKSFENKLDEFFAADHYDATNEPDLQSPFLYDYINRPWKTQKIVAETADKVFTDEPGGLAGGGNDDLGEMSAWYILSQLGFYPVDPGVPYFEVCTPRFPKATLHLGSAPDAKTFVIEAPDAAPQNLYIQSATLNGQPLNKPWFAEKEITQGGGMTVAVGTQPNRQWAASPLNRPYSLSTGFSYVPPEVKSSSLLPTDKSGRVIWRYTTSKPAEDWMHPEFVDSDWPQGPAGFGTEDEGVSPRTPWNSDDIWLRTSFDLKKLPSRGSLSVYHDQGMEVFVNGILAGKETDWVHDYEPVKSFSVDDPNTPLLRLGKNVIALHVHHAGDGRHFADATVLELTLPSSE